jgi:hypothetical protein
MRDMIRGPQKPSVIVHKDEPLPPPIQPLAKPAPAPKTTVTVSAPAIDTRVLVGAAVLGGLVVMVMGGKKK